MNNEEHVSIKIYDYIFILDDDTCVEQKSNRREFAHMKGSLGIRREWWTTDFSQNLGTFIVYNSHMTCSNSSFSLVMVTSMSHFFVFHWLQFTSMCCLFPIGYLPKPTSRGRHICHHSLSLITSIGQGDILKSPCWYYLCPGEAVNNTCWYNNTCRTWWHSGNPPPILSMYLSTISAVFNTCRSC